MPQSGVPHLVNHENWYHCDGVCDDSPRNKLFSHGFGSRYQFPLPTVKDAPVPSQADYSQANVAWMIEFFAGVIGSDPSEVVFRYENNTPDDKTDDILVSHPGGEYLPTATACNFKKSPELKRYEAAAKKSKLLKLYQDNSPAGITFFNQICPNP
jgi:hypothetical protein